MLEACADARGELMVLLMSQEDLRRKEVAGLQVGDVDWSERTVAVRGKGGPERVLPVSDETWEALLRYLAEHPPPSGGPLIRSYRSEHAGLSPTMLGRYVSEWMYLAGVKRRPNDGRSAHSLHHSMATDMLRGGAHLRDVQAALGHTSLVNTQRYLPRVVNDLRDAMGGRRYRGAGT